MPSRHRSRQRALQVLFQIDLRRQPAEEAIAALYNSLLDEEVAQPERPIDSFMEELVRGTVDRMEEIDRRLAEHSKHWRLERMPAVDRNIVRLAVCEMLFILTPPAVAIDEALELARRFTSDESIPFINGVLDAIHRQMFEQK